MAQTGRTMTRIKKFWRRITDGMALNQLWIQFHADARSSLRLYSNEVDFTRPLGIGKSRHSFHLATQFFWTIVEKLTPARRVLLLLALVFLSYDVETSWQGSDRGANGLGGSFWGGLLLFGLLILEVADRVVMKRDLQIAKEIQAKLLPANPPHVPGLEIAFFARPANTVAGDYYDVFLRSAANASGETFLIAVADVAGKSVPAAMLMATFQASLKTLATTPCTLTELAGCMNTYACSNSQNGRRFITAFIAEYDPVSRSLIYVNAGHNPPVLRHQTGAMQHLSTGGIPLGIQENFPYESGMEILQADDWLVIYTDGLTEAEDNRSQEYGEARLLTLLHANATAKPSVLLNTIMMDLDRFSGNTLPQDDVTLMLLRAS